MRFLQAIEVNGCGLTWLGRFRAFFTPPLYPPNPYYICDRPRSPCQVYHKLGNVGFLGFTGAATFQEMKPYFAEVRSVVKKWKVPGRLILRDTSTIMDRI